ncbi:MAG: hypothetical protein AAGB01_11265 [Cyanobacteria bacterium P01_F01_bin.42]
MDGLENLTKDDRLELLSAYMDNELPANERKMVESWLESDPEVKQQYRSLLTLSHSFQAMPMPQSSASADEMLNAVFAEVDRKPRFLKLAGVATAVVAAVGALGAFLGGADFSPQVASTEVETASQPSRDAQPINRTNTDISLADTQVLETDSLMLVLDAPPVAIPVVANSVSTRD